MVTAEIADSVMNSRVYLGLVGVVLLTVGIQGFTGPNTWVLASGMLGSVFNVLPDVIHQLLGILVAVGGATQIGRATDLY